VKNSIICEVTTAHPRDDIRIFQKYCTSLSDDFTVELLVQDGKSDKSYSEKLSTKDLKTTNFLGMFSKYYNIFKYLKSKQNKSEVLVHMHDPELMPLAIFLGVCRYKVVFDFHEDYVKQLDSKPYLNEFQKAFFRILFRPLMYLTCKLSKLTIGVTPQLVNKLTKYKDNSMLVENYPILNEIVSSHSEKEKTFIYAGNISEIRGIHEMLEFLVLLNGSYRLILCGKFRCESLEAETRSHPGWKYVDYQGIVDRQTLNQLFARCIAGLIFFRKVPNNLDSRPNKFYEYMEASLPIIASDIPSWETFINKNQCGITINTSNFDESSVQLKVLDKEEELAELGKNGRLFIENNYSWQYKYNDIRERFMSIL